MNIWKKLKLLLRASGQACKELGSHHSILTTNKNLNKLRNQQLFSDLSEKWGHRANHWLQNWRDRQAETDNQNLSEQKLRSKNHHGNNCWGRKPELQMLQSWRLSVDKPKSQKLQGANYWGRNTLFFSLKARLHYHSKNQRKTFLGFQYREGKSNYCEVFQSILFDLTRPVLKKN